MPSFPFLSPPRRATAMPPPPPLFPHIVGSRHGATEPPMRTAPSRRAEQCRTPRAERAACRRYAIMVSPTQSVPEVLAVWGSDYKIAIVCRRYTIMVAQPPSQISHITNPTTNPHHTHHHPRPYHNRVPPARCSFHSPPHRPSTPSNNPQKKMSNKPKDLIAHFLSPLRCGRDSNSRPHA